MIVKMFKPQFAPLVEAGTKCQTVRPLPKRTPKAGDKISLRMWTGKPYRSKQRVLRESEIVAVQTLRMTESDMWLDGVRQTGNQNWEFALADGFKSSREMCNWFADTHGLPFYGVVIKWHNAELTDAGPVTPASRETQSRHSVQ